LPHQNPVKLSNFVKDGIIPLSEEAYKDLGVSKEVLEDKDSVNYQWANKLTETSPEVTKGVETLNKTKGATCSSCGVPNGLHQRTCPEYVAKLAKLDAIRKPCPSCGSIMPTEAKFCARCGSSIT
jgi:hypothetical protein